MSIRNLRRILAAAFLFLVPFTGFAQSAFLPDGKNGTEISIGTGITHETFGYGGTFGFSVKGRLDLRFALMVLSGAQKGTAYSPTIEFHLMKSSPASPFGVSLGLSAEGGSYGSGGEVSVVAPSIFATACYLFQTSESFGIMPAYVIRGILSFEQSNEEFGIVSPAPGGYGIQSISGSKDNERFILSQVLGAAFVFGRDGQMKFLLSPSVAVTSDAVLLGFEAGIVF
jgi:hypothetical protein